MICIVLNDLLKETKMLITMKVYFVMVYIYCFYDSLINLFKYFI